MFPVTAMVEAASAEALEAAESEMTAVFAIGTTKLGGWSAGLR